MCHLSHNCYTVFTQKYCQEIVMTRLFLHQWPYVDNYEMQVQSSIIFIIHAQVWDPWWSSIGPKLQDECNACITLWKRRSLLLHHWVTLPRVTVSLIFQSTEILKSITNRTNQLSKFARSKLCLITPSYHAFPFGAIDKVKRTSFGYPVILALPSQSHLFLEFHAFF